MPKTATTKTSVSGTLALKRGALDFRSRTRGRKRRDKDSET